MWSYFSEGKFLGDIKFYLAIFLLFLGIIVWKSCRQSQKIDKQPNLEYKVPEKYKDEKGTVHNQITQEVTTESILNHLVDSLISDNKRLRNAVSLTQVVVHTDTVFKERIIWKDSIEGNFEISKKDNWVDIVARGNIKTGEGEISLKTKDTISIVTYRKNHLFKPDETRLDISFASPYQQIDKARSYIIPEKKTIISGGPVLGYGTNGKNWSWYIGGGITWNLFSIKTRK